MRTTALLVVALLAVAVITPLLLGRGDPVRRATILRRLGFGLIAFETAFFGSFVVGDTLADPGGRQAVGLITAWLVPLAVLCALAWRRPGVATWVLGVLTAAVVTGSIWFAVDPQGWRTLEDDIGPVRAIAAFVIVAALGVLGLARTRTAGVLLLVAGGVPVLLGSVGRGGLSSLAMVGVPALLAGALYVASALTHPRPAAPADTPAGVPPAPQVS